jgi:uncharacterized coiled-coil protein SlyX
VYSASNLDLFTATMNSIESLFPAFQSLVDRLEDIRLAMNEDRRVAQESYFRSCAMMSDLEIRMGLQSAKLENLESEIVEVKDECSKLHYAQEAILSSEESTQKLVIAIGEDCNFKLENFHLKCGVIEEKVDILTKKITSLKQIVENQASTINELTSKCSTVENILPDRESSKAAMVVPLAVKTVTMSFSPIKDVPVMRAEEKPNIKDCQVNATASEVSEKKLLLEGMKLWWEENRRRDMLEWQEWRADLHRCYPPPTVPIQNVSRKLFGSNSFNCGCDYDSCGDNSSASDSFSVTSEIISDNMSDTSFKSHRDSQKDEMDAAPCTVDEREYFEDVRVQEQESYDERDEGYNFDVEHLVEVLEELEYGDVIYA